MSFISIFASMFRKRLAVALIAALRASFAWNFLRSVSRWANLIASEAWQ